MASTRNKNTSGNYQLEQLEKYKQANYQVFENGSCAKASTTNLPGNGLLTGRIASSSLSNNYCDIESFLYGIGSTNLVKPSENLVANIYEIDSLNIIKKPPVIVDPFLIPTTVENKNTNNWWDKIEQNQRPLFS